LLGSTGSELQSSGRLQSGGGDVMTKVDKGREAAKTAYFAEAFMDGPYAILIIV